MKNEVMTIREFCEWAKIGYSTYFAWKEKGLTPKSAKIGGKVFISFDAIKKWKKLMEK